MTYKTYEVHVYNDGNIFWYHHDRFHRDNGPAIEYSDGTTSWYQNGQLHREDGPAIEYPSGTKKWCQNGKLHRTDGPAIEFPDGTKCWYLNGTQYTETEFLKKINPPKELTVAEIEKLLGYSVKIVKDA
jgi:hypothetical protein